MVFACYEKSCAPPPAGHGGSSPSGRAYRASHAAYAKMGAEARGRIDERIKAKNKHKKVPTGLAQDGTTNRPNAGGLGGGSVGSKSATHSAFRDADAITPRKSGGAVSTRHHGNEWEITVTDSRYKVTHRRKSRARTPELALDALVKEYNKHA